MNQRWREGRERWTHCWIPQQGKTGETGRWCYTAAYLVAATLQLAATPASYSLPCGTSNTVRWPPTTDRQPPTFAPAVCSVFVEKISPLFRPRNWETFNQIPGPRDRLLAAFRFPSSPYFFLRESMFASLANFSSFFFLLHLVAFVFNFIAIFLGTLSSKKVHFIDIRMNELKEKYDVGMEKVFWR